MRNEGEGGKKEKKISSGMRRKLVGVGGSLISASYLPHLCNPPPRVTVTPQTPYISPIPSRLKYMLEIELEHLVKMRNQQPIFPLLQERKDHGRS